MTDLKEYSDDQLIKKTDLVLGELAERGLSNEYSERHEESKGLAHLKF